MRLPTVFTTGILFACLQASSAVEPSPAFTHLAPIYPQILAAAKAFPGGGYKAENILMVTGPGASRAYASHQLGAKTFIDFDFGRAEAVAAFRHVQRRTPDTIAKADLLFSDTPDFSHIVATVNIQHVDEPGAMTFASFRPVRARYVRWQVTSVLPERSPNVGGHSIEFFAAGKVDKTPDGITLEAHTIPVIEQSDEGLVQPLKLTLNYPYAETKRATVNITGQTPETISLRYGTQTLRNTLLALDTEQSLDIQIEIEGKEVAAQAVKVPPARKMTVYLLPHSHTDIGYTGLQTDIEEKQINNLLEGLAAARRTANYPEGARFVWNVEVLWAADLFLERLPKEYHEQFFNAVKQGQVSLNGMYLNELTGLCRPEELTRLFRYATQLTQQTGVPVDSAMISDVPGYTWGTVTAMNQAGIKYFSVAPNYFARIGDILVQWENKPFWWIGPDNKSKVLVWIPFWGYAMAHRYGEMSAQLVEDFCEGLVEREYPYDIAYARWAGHGDNAVPDPIICEFVKEWNADHVSPRFVISSTSEAFRAFEDRYGDELPKVRGDWTPYWEDGAGSSAAETAMNRNSSERLAQAETLWAILDPKHYPVHKFTEAWKNVLLYSEHTWGAHCSVSQPANPFTTDQWNIKQSYATAANLQSRQLLSEAAQAGEGFVAKLSDATVDVFNTTSWSRSEIAIIPVEIARGYHLAVDAAGQPVPAQRLVSHDLAVLVRDLPPFSGRRLRLAKDGLRPAIDAVKVTGTVIENGRLRIRVDDKTGDIVELQAHGIDVNLAATADGRALNKYLYLIGDDPANIQSNGPVTISVRERGPLVASLLIESDAPGCHKLLREIRLVAGADHVELINTVDKKRLEAANYVAADGKESLNFAFPFNVPGGEMRLDIPYGVIRPEHDQMPSACKNWLTIGRWADVSNSHFGVTWATLDAPLAQVGGLSATLLNYQSDPSVWRKTIKPTQKLISWAMNNHWDTNYRAYQEGPVVFRYVLRPHRHACNDAQASRFATNFSQPLIAVPGRGIKPNATPLVQVEPSDVLVTGLKPSDDGKALIARLLNSTDQAIDAKLTWSQPVTLHLSDTSEQPKQRIAGHVQVPPRTLITLRAELP
ncbi:glycoside hydrolase family 38 C-terminal domain-containing protein [Planctomycetota bacterium]